MGICSKRPGREQYSKQGRLKELKHLSKRFWSSKVLKDFLSWSIVWASDNKMQWMCFSEVNLLSNMNTKGFWKGHMESEKFAYEKVKWEGS